MAPVSGPWAYRDRADAGRLLGTLLRGLVDGPVVVLGVPRGGVPVAYEVSRALGAALDVVLARKLGAPHQPELAIGAIGEGGVRVLNPALIEAAGLAACDVELIASREQAALADQVRRYRTGRRPVPLAGTTAVVVDDGIATGATARAACEVAAAAGARRVVVGAPVGSPRAIEALADVADTVACLQQPASFGGVGQFYRDFSPTPDAVVAELLDRRAAELAAKAAGGPPGAAGEP